MGHAENLRSRGRDGFFPALTVAASENGGLGQFWLGRRARGAEIAASFAGDIAQAKSAARIGRSGSHPAGTKLRTSAKKPDLAACFLTGAPSGPEFSMLWLTHVQGDGRRQRAGRPPAPLSIHDSGSHSDWSSGSIGVIAMQWWLSGFTYHVDLSVLDLHPSGGRHSDRLAHGLTNRS